MRIALLVDTLAGGGAERVVQLLATGLAQRGHQVFVYCLKTTARSVSHLVAEGVVVREARSRGRDPLLIGRLAYWLWRDRVELAHLHSSAAVVCGLPAARLLGVATVHVRHVRCWAGPASTSGSRTGWTPLSPKSSLSLRRSAGGCRRPGWHGALCTSPTAATWCR
jgi:hypothetical protein